MKICPVCHESYTDENLNFCLNDGNALSTRETEQPTVVFDPVRQTNPLGNDLNTGLGWENQPLVNNQNFGAAGYSQTIYEEQNQTLPTVSLTLGILSMILCCCGLGVPLGAGGIVTGFLALQNINREPIVYTGRGMAVGGIVTGIIGLTVAIIMLIFSSFG